VSTVRQKLRGVITRARLKEATVTSSIIVRYINRYYPFWMGIILGFLCILITNLLGGIGFEIF